MSKTWNILESIYSATTHWREQLILLSAQSLKKKIVPTSTPFIEVSRKRNSDYNLYLEEFHYCTLNYKNSDLLWSFVEASVCTGNWFLPASGPRGLKLGVSLQTFVRGGLILPASGSDLVKRKGDEGSRRVDVGRDLAEPR